MWVSAWLLVYLALSLPPVSDGLARGLTALAQQLPQSPGQPVAIVVLTGSASYFPVGGSDVAVATVGTKLRALEAARLYRQTRLPVIVSGTEDRDAGARAAQPAALRAALVAAGVAPDDVLLDLAATNTHESGASVRALLAKRNWRGPVLVVTSATHLARAARVFLAEHVPIRYDAAPVRATEPPSYADLLVPNADALQFSEECLHEYVGLAYYTLRGWI